MIIYYDTYSNIIIRTPFKLIQSQNTSSYTGFILHTSHLGMCHNRNHTPSRGSMWSDLDGLHYYDIVVYLSHQHSNPIIIILYAVSVYTLEPHSSIFTLMEFIVWFQHFRRVTLGRYLSIALHIPISSSVTMGMGAGALALLREGMTTLICFMSSS